MNIIAPSEDQKILSEIAQRLNVKPFQSCYIIEVYKSSKAAFRDQIINRWKYAKVIEQKYGKASTQYYKIEEAILTDFLFYQASEQLFFEKLRDISNRLGDISMTMAMVESTFGLCDMYATLNQNLSHGTDQQTEKRA